MPLPRARRVAVLRALGVLLVLLGVVSMHQLAGGHHRSAQDPTHGRHQAQVADTTASEITTAGGITPAGRTMGTGAPVGPERPLAGTSAPSGKAPEQMPMADAHRPVPPTNVLPLTTPTTPGALVALGSALTGTGGDHDGMPACLAVLTALLVLLLPVLAHLLPAPARRPLARRSRTSPPARGPPRDLLAQLCVLRT